MCDCDLEGQKRGTQPEVKAAIGAFFANAGHKTVDLINHTKSLLSVRPSAGEASTCAAPDKDKMKDGDGLK